MKGDVRCVDGHRMRHDPAADDPDLETDIGECPECEGRGCATTLSRVIDVCESVLGVAREKITPDAMLVDDLGADDVDFVELAMEISVEFCMPEFDESDLANLRRVSDIVSFIDRV